MIDVICKQGILQLLADGTLRVIPIFGKKPPVWQIPSQDIIRIDTYPSSMGSKDLVFHTNYQTYRAEMVSTVNVNKVLESFPISIVGTSVLPIVPNPYSTTPVFNYYSPTPPPSPVPQSLSRPSVWNWYKQRTPLGKIGYGCFSLIVILIACSIFGSVASVIGGSNSATIVSQTSTPTITQVIHPQTPTPKPTVKLAPTSTPAPTPTPTPTVEPQQIPTPPPASPVPTCNGTLVDGICYSFDPTGGVLVYNPAPDFCSYFSCIANFSKGRGYVVECNDGMFSKSGGIPGSCSRHNGNMRPIYQH
jgi:hypothetical protein